jgi:hypothetical protein
MKTYIVWVGGCSMYEGKNKDKAMIDFNEWINQGYDDVILEEIEE